MFKVYFCQLFIFQLNQNKPVFEIMISLWTPSYIHGNLLGQFGTWLWAIQYVIIDIIKIKTNEQSLLFK